MRAGMITILKKTFKTLICLKLLPIILNNNHNKIIKLIILIKIKKKKIERKKIKH